MSQTLETTTEEPQKKTTKEELINNIREWIKIDTDVAALKNDIKNILNNYNNFLLDNEMYFSDLSSNNTIDINELILN